MVAMRVLAVGVCLSALVGCSATDDGGQRTSLMNTGLFTDISAKKPRPEKDGGLAMSVSNSASSMVATDGPASGGAKLQRMAFVGEESLDEGGATPGANGASYRLNFENADVREVVQAVLGETLKLNFTMTEDVSGKVTISSPRAMTGQELLAALESSLSANGFSMTKSTGGYRIAPTAVGGGVVDTPFATQPSYGVSVVPLRHVSAATMGKLVAGFVAENDGLRVDTARNAMVVRGPGAKRQEAVDTIMSFDADWMQNQAVGIYEVRQAQPDAVVAELNRVFDAEQQRGATSGVIQFKPVNRLRAVMVVSKNPALLKRAETWVKRLDRDTASGAENVFVYKARYRDAKELARIVTSLFRAGGDGGQVQSASTGQRSATASGSSSGSDNNSSDSSSRSSSSFGSSSSSFGSNSSSGSSSQSRPGSSGSQSAFNNPNFDQPGSGGSDSSASPGGGDSIDLTTQAAGERANVLVSADPANNAVVVYADGYTYQKIHAALRQLDSAPLQVAIQATIAEVTLKDEMRQGVEYFVKSNSVGLGKDNGSVSLFGTAGGRLAKQIPGFNVLLGANTNADVIISALDQVTDVEVLSSPSLVVAENQPANFQVGDEVPVQTQSLASASQNPSNPTLLNSVEFRDTGVILNVTPRIGSNDAVTMQIEQEISAVAGGADTLTPTISKRRIASNISVVSGQTVLLAGLISKRDAKGKNGIPLLGDLPGVGGLFSQRNRTQDRTELVVFIRPTVIRTGEDAQSVAEEFRSRLLVNKSGAAGAMPASFSK
jgi:general secretion pathway protein D